MAPPASRAPQAARRGLLHDGLYQRIPLAAIGAFALPLGLRAAADLTDVAGFCFDHERLLLQQAPLFQNTGIETLDEAEHLQ